MNTLGAIEHDMRRHLYMNIVLSGGNTRFHGEQIVNKDSTLVAATANGCWSLTTEHAWLSIMVHISKALHRMSESFESRLP